MANKYIRHGATYNGDGTSSAEATVNGGVGAWNTITYFEGATPAYGTIVVGDIIYIRSKDAAGANITRAITATTNLGSTAPTVSTAPVTWILDNGAVWSGIDGVLAYQSTSGNITTNILSYNRVIASTQDAIRVVTSNTWGSDWRMLHHGVGVYTNRLYVDCGAWTQGYNTSVTFASSIAENFHIVVGNLPSGILFQGAEYANSDVRLINPTIEVNGASIGQCIVAPQAYQGSVSLTFIGGRIFGAAADAGLPLTKSVSYPGRVRFIGTKIPRTMVTSTAGLSASELFEVIGCDEDGTGSYIEAVWGWATSRTDNYPPYLNATLPGAALTPWSWRLYPKSASISVPASLNLSKFFSDTPATKTITCNVLVANTMTPNKDKLWMTVEYMDSATGAMKHLSTKDFTGAASDTSTAAWLPAATWGMIAFDKYQMTIATTTSIKQDSLIIVTLFCAMASATANDMLFIDPDFTVN